MTVCRRQFLAGGVLIGLSSAAGCGTILYPERRGQPAGQLDWGVVVLDGIGLFFFFVPGIIAFAVDFASGTIYLPSERSPTLAAGQRPTALKPIVVGAESLSRAEIAKTVSAETGQAVTLAEGTYYATELSDLDGFWPAVEVSAETHQKRTSL